MKLTNNQAYFEQEAVLNDDIQFKNPLSKYALNPQAVLLIGATGLVGGFLLEELLQKTEATIYCLVRAEDAQAGKQRLVQHLQSYNLWQAAFDSRVVPIIGDLVEPSFGLTDDEFNTLASTIDVIYHSAGWINLLYPYARLKPINVTGVEHSLRLASLVQTKPLHFVSSIAVFYSDAHSAEQTLFETTIPLFDMTLKADYGKSKWVADRLVADAQARGLPACIYRPVRIMGSAKTGALNDNSELLPRLLKGCIKMGIYPAWDIEITLVPVDYVSGAMVHLAKQAENWGKAFHFFNPKPIAWLDLMSILQNHHGYIMKEVSADEWSQELRHFATWDNPDDADSKRFFAMLMVAFTGSHYLFHPRPPFDGHNIETGLVNSDITCPPIDEELISKYVAYWQKTGFLPTAEN
jgi:thioester reductase-like protein